MIGLGSVGTFADVRRDKAQALKVLEEAAEVFGAWQALDGGEGDPFLRTCDLVDECADVIQATCNLLAAYGITGMAGAMDACRERNEARGREYADQR